RSQGFWPRVSPAPLASSPSVPAQPDGQTTSPTVAGCPASVTGLSKSLLSDRPRRGRLSAVPGVAIALFTRDLRVHDNPALRAAADVGRVVPLFVLDDGCGDFVRPNRAAFLLECLDDLGAQLRERGAKLVVRRGDVVEEVRKVAGETGAEQVHVAA